MSALRRERVIGAANAPVLTVQLLACHCRVCAHPRFYDAADRAVRAVMSERRAFVRAQAKGFAP